MFLVLWEFDVKHGSEQRFESVYGPAGDWAQLFRRDPHYQQTRLLHDVSRPQTYLALDIWESREFYAKFKSQNQEAYSALDKTCEALTVAERFLGSFEQPAELHK
jgi:heme-degrading monooxygenase HmoA